MAARQDMDIKADVIVELEDVRALHTEANILDALMVESVTVNKGLVELTLIYPDDRLAQDQAALAKSVEDRLEDIEGVEGLQLVHLSRQQMRARDPLVWFGDEAAASTRAPARPAPQAPPASDLLTLGALLSKVEDEGGAQDAPEAPRGGISLYEGGGCAAGTAVPAATAPAPALARDTSLPVAASPAAAPVAPASPPATISGAQVTLDLARYEALLLAEREAFLRPSLQEHQELLIRHRVLEARVRALQDSVRQLLP